MVAAQWQLGLEASGLGGCQRDFFLPGWHLGWDAGNSWGLAEHLFPSSPSHPFSPLHCAFLKFCPLRLPWWLRG